jgi:formate dehydrogenase major subunit
MGSNMAENHPVGFQWVMEAKLKGTRVFHVDPRYTRTSAMATDYLPLRAGTDIAFLGGVVNYILENERDFREYVVNYTNAPVILNEDFRDTEELDGLFSGWDPEKKRYSHTTWQYAGMDVEGSGHGEEGSPRGEQSGHGGAGGRLRHGEPPAEDHTLQHPRCVFQVLKRHFSRYTPEFVEQVCGTPREQFLDLCETLCANSGRERTSAFVYSVGWTQHTVGVQYIRTAAIIQLLLGNIGRPGGGIMALRGHASIQGSTDIPTLFNILPGYIPMPHASKDDDLATYLELNTAHAGFWGKLPAYFVSLLKAWWGEHATQENEFGFGWLPRIGEDHSAYQHALGMLDGTMKGYFLLGQNPAVGSSNSRLHRFALANLDWLVVRDFFEIESASFWKDGPEIETGEMKPDEIKTEVFFMPAASHTEKDGSFTNTQRLLQWHHKAVEPKGDCRSELWFMYHLGRKIREKLADSKDAKNEGVRRLTWQYTTAGEIAEPSADEVLREINGVDSLDKALSGYTDLKSDGSTACGCWIYSGVYADETNHAAAKTPEWEQDWVAAKWGWAWPTNRRIIYNRASADPAGKPWSERKKYVWWDEKEGRWTGSDVPDFEPTKPPDYEPPPDAEAEHALRGDHPFILQADGQGWLFAPSGLVDGPLPTHYEPHESPFENPLYSVRANPARQQFPRTLNEFNPSGDATGAGRYPYVVTSYRLTESHTSGAMTRTVDHLAELQPEFFCEVSPELAEERNLEHGGWATIITARTAIEARVHVTDRVPPLDVMGQKVHQVGLPYHWGYKGLVTGDSANDLFAIALDPNVHIQEVKAATCDIRPGRRPRGPALPKFVEAHRPPDTIRGPQ